MPRIIRTWVERIELCGHQAPAQYRANTDEFAVRSRWTLMRECVKHAAEKAGYRSGARTRKQRATIGLCRACTLHKEHGKMRHHRLSVLKSFLWRRNLFCGQPWMSREEYSGIPQQIKVITLPYYRDHCKCFPLSDCVVCMRRVQPQDEQQREIFSAGDAGASAIGVKDVYEETRKGGEEHNTQDSDTWQK